MIKSVNNYPISQLFDINANVTYFVPRYQREYTWGHTHWEDIFDDILDNDPGYFLGSIICINKSNDTLAVQQLEVVDGQQRLTTISLLFSAIYRTLKEHADKLDEEQKSELINLKRMLVLKKDNGKLRLALQKTNNNDDDYRAKLSEVGITDSYEVKPYAGNRKIFRAFKYFQDRIESLIDSSEQSLTKILELLEKVNGASMVKIEVESHAHAYTLFESLNNRGMPLTAIDLIKNKLLAKLDECDKGRADHYFDIWNKLLNCLGDDNAIQERFFRHYYNAYRSELRSIASVPVATRSNLIHIYEKLINQDAKIFIDKISMAGQNYSILLLNNQNEKLNGLEKPLKDLDRIQGAPSYLLLLYLIGRSDELQLKTHHLEKIINLLVCFFVRRNLTDLPPTRDLTRLFMSIIEKISEFKGEKIIDLVRDELVKVSASEQVFREKLDGPMYDENYGVTRFILLALAEQGMTKETWVDLWKFENKQFVWTVEHIFPQGNNIPECWVKMIADGNIEKAKEFQEKYVHKLGNLTISGFNSTLGNKSFEEKRDRVDKAENFVGYRNGLKLNEDLVNCQTWDISKIESRTQKLADQAMKIFKLNGDN